MLYSNIGAILDSYLLCRLSNYLLTSKFSSRFRYVPGLLTLAILLVRYLIFESFESNSVFYIISKSIATMLIFFVVFFCYTGSVKRRAAVFFLFCLILMVVEGFVLCILLLFSTSHSYEALLKTREIEILSLCFCKLITFFIIEAIQTRVRRIKNFTLSYTKELTFIFIYNLFLFFLMIYLLTSPIPYDQMGNQILLIVAVNVFFISVLCSMLIVKNVQRSKRELEYQLALQQMEMEHTLNQDMTSVVEKLRCFRHDINNHFSIMSGLIKEKQYGELEGYLDGITRDINCMNKFIFTDNKALTVLLNHKLTKATANGIDFQIELKTKYVPLSDQDLCTLFGNILDNAIDACLLVKENPFIHLSIVTKGSQYCIRCINSYAVEPTRHEGRLLTTKRNSEIHGIGLENIKRVVQKNDGELDIQFRDHIFTIQVLIHSATPQVNS